jgi:release factor glutamine methyltransferase
MVSQESEWLLREKYGGQKSEAFLADLARLEAGEPLAYLIGHIPFLQTTISLHSKPLIPRPETEYWVEKCLAAIGEQQNILERPLRILDLCAGSGAIGVAVGSAVTESTVDFIEIDPTHYQTILQNCLQNNISEERVRIMSGNLLRELPKNPSLGYDFILTNPPYIDATLGRTADSVKDFEPALALYGGEAGLELITEIIQTAPEHLRAAGQLWIEHEPEQSLAIQTIGENSFVVTTHKDQYGTERFSQLVLQ